MRVRKRHLILGLLLLAALAVGIPVLADYTGPDRVVSTFVWERKVCDYQAVYDPPGPGWYGCSLTLYEPPDGSCPSNVAGYFTTSACGWPQAFCQNPGCSISKSSSIDGCNQGQPGCRQVEKQSSLPEATISGSITCASPGSNGWCRGGGALDLSGDEPVSGESILAIEGTHNGATFACSGDSCSVGLNEGDNDFTFWAISSFGDTSRMGSASGRQDSQDPSLSGSASGTGGDNGWYVSDVTIDASADDSLSGLASLDVRINGGGWSSYGGAFSLGDGSHTVELRAVDAAGNTNSDSFSVDIDTGDPFVDLDATPSFCAGCGETADVTINVGDSGSGVASWKLTAGGATVASGSGGISQTIAWDGSGLGGGTYSLDLDARDVAGNSASASFTVGIIAPTPVPDEDETEDQSRGRSFTPPTVTATPPEPIGVEEGPDSPTILASTSTPRPTATPRTITFGALPVSPADDGASSGPAPQTSPSSSGPTVPSGALYGAAALAVIAGATAVAAENLRRRREEEARKREEMARLNAEAEALDKARAAAIAAARAEAELAQGQILSAATGGEAPSPTWLAAAAAAAAAAAREADRLRRLWRKEEKLEPQVPPPVPPFDMAKWKQQDYAEVARYRTAGESVGTPTPEPVSTPSPQARPTPPPTATPTPIPPRSRARISDTFPPPGFPDPRSLVPPFSLGALETYEIPRWNIGPLLEYGDVYSSGGELSSLSAMEGGLSGGAQPGDSPSVRQYLKASLGPLDVSVQRTVNWPKISITWRSSPVVATLPDSGTRVVFTNSVSVQGSGSWFGRTTTVRYNYLEYRVSPDSSVGYLPSEGATAGNYLRYNNMLPATAMVVAGVLVAGTVLTQGQLPIWLQQLGQLGRAPVPVP